MRRVIDEPTHNHNKISRENHKTHHRYLKSGPDYATMLPLSSQEGTNNLALLASLHLCIGGCEEERSTVHV
jgi:hypothetical protein